jgi:hypothetical protein
VLLESDWLASEDWKQQELTFSSRQAALARLALTYQRALGTARFEGSVSLRNLTIDPAP